MQFSKSPITDADMKCSEVQSSVYIPPKNDTVGYKATRKPIKTYISHPLLPVAFILFSHPLYNPFQLIHL